MTAAVVGDIGISEAELRDAYERHNGVVRQVADEIDQSEEVARTRLIKYDIHEPASYLTHDLEELRPQDVGLSPLRCGSCRTKIADHPCPECHWAPGETQSTFDQFSGGDA